MTRLIVFLFIIFSNQVYAQQPVVFEQLQALQDKEERLIVVFIETGWCKYCQAMKNSIRKNRELSALLERKFYTVFLDAETKNDIVFGGKVFKFKPTGINTGVHELAEALGTVDGQLKFPTLCILNKRNEIVYQYTGFIAPSLFTNLLNILLSR